MNVALRKHDNFNRYINSSPSRQVLKMMVGTNLKDVQLQQIVDKTILIADTDGDGKISFEEFSAVSPREMEMFD